LDYVFFAVQSTPYAFRSMNTVGLPLGRTTVKLGG